MSSIDRCRAVQPSNPWIRQVKAITKVPPCSIPMMSTPLRDIMWADIGVSSGIISDLAAVEAVMAPTTSLSRNPTVTITTTMESVTSTTLTMTTMEFTILSSDSTDVMVPTHSTTTTTVFSISMTGMTTTTVSSKVRSITMLLKHKDSTPKCIDRPLCHLYHCSPMG